MSKILFTVLILLALFIAFIFGIKYLNEAVFVDFSHGFILTDIKGWKAIPPKEGAYKSLATSKDNIIISYADIRFIKKGKILDERTMVRIAKEECQNSTNEPNITSKNAEVEEFQKNGSTVVKCNVEGLGVVNKLPTIITMYSFFGSKDNVLVITTSYPKGNNLEEIKAQRLIDGLKFF